MEDRVEFPAKLVRSSGSYLVIYVPTRIVRAYGLEPGEFVIVTLKRVPERKTRPRARRR